MGAGVTYRARITRAQRPEGHGWSGLHREPRAGVCLHYDASSSDRGSVAWFKDPRARNVGYTYLILDDGEALLLAPYTARVYHAGRCRPSRDFQLQAPYRDANSALIGVSIAATDGDRATVGQVEVVAAICHDIFVGEGWPLAETWRITGHEDEAWPRGRKIDPTGSDPERPVLSVAAVRATMRER